MPLEERGPASPSLWLWVLPSLAGAHFADCSNLPPKTQAGLHGPSKGTRFPGVPAGNRGCLVRAALQLLAQRQRKGQAGTKCGRQNFGWEAGVEKTRGAGPTGRRAGEARGGGRGPSRWH